MGPVTTAAATAVAALAVVVVVAADTGTGAVAVVVAFAGPLYATLALSRFGRPCHPSPSCYRHPPDVQLNLLARTHTPEATVPVGEQDHPKAL